MNALTKRPSREGARSYESRPSPATPDPLQASSAPRHCHQQETRIVAVPVPRFDSAAGRVFAILEANPKIAFVPEHIARLLKTSPELVRTALIQLRSRGLVTATHQAAAGRPQGVWFYKVARDLRDQIREEPFG